MLRGFVFCIWSLKMDATFFRLEPCHSWNGSDLERKVTNGSEAWFSCQLHRQRAEWFSKQFEAPAIVEILLLTTFPYCLEHAPLQVTLSLQTLLRYSRACSLSLIMICRLVSWKKKRGFSFRCIFPLSSSHFLPLASRSFVQCFVYFCVWQLISCPIPWAYCLCMNAFIYFFVLT